MKKMVAIVLLMCLIVGIQLLQSDRAYACSCGNPSVAKRFEGASVVFAGTLVSKDTEGGNIFNVDKVWKGSLPDGYVFGGFFGMCGTEFNLGSEYLVYTYNFKGKEMTSLCSGNKLLTDANEDIQALNRLAVPWVKEYMMVFVVVLTIATLTAIWKAQGRFRK
jgi:hypothetical protein